MAREIHNFVKIGDASDELKDLYRKGWRLIAVITPYAVSIPENATYSNNHLYTYAVEYFLERDI